MTSRLSPLALVIAAIPAAAQSPYDLKAAVPDGFNRARAARETLAYAEALIALDTQTPPGNELLTAEFFATLLGGVEGFKTEIIEVGEGRANFVARLSGPKTRLRPILLLGHMDVVGAEKEAWTTPPFSPTTKDGYLYGRGAIDDKGPLAASVAALLQLAGRRASMERDIIFLATAAEEGGPAVGIDWVIENRREVLGDAEFALNEGGRLRVVAGKLQTVNIQTTEKIYYTVRAHAKGPSGHGSVPLPDNAIAALARAASRVHEWLPPMHLIPTTRTYFAGLANLEVDPIVQLAMRNMLGDEAESAALAVDYISRIPEYNALLRAGIALTMFNGGFRENVIPSGASAVFNVRIVPGDDIVSIVKGMQNAAQEDAVTFELDGEPKVAPPESSTRTKLFESLTEAATAMAPDAVVLPFMSTGGTDGAALRAIGIPTYGILPFPLEREDELRMHGNDERVPLAALGWGAEFIYRTLAAATQ